MNICMTMLFLGILLLIISSVVSTKRQVSGNAMDLANMNINMMNRKCPIQTCQTVCLQKQESGCFMCNPSCSSGNNLGSLDGGLQIPITSGQGNFYSGCHGDSNWMNCPLSCQHKYDGKGCFQCLCQTSGVTTAAVTAENQSKAEYHQQTGFQAKTSPSPLTVISATMESTERIVGTNSVPIDTTDTTMSAKPIPFETVTISISPTVSISDSRHVTSASSSSAGIFELYTESPTETQTPIPLSKKATTKSPGTTQRAVRASTSMDSVPVTDDSLPIKNEQSDNTETFEFKPNNLSFFLFGLMLVFVVLSLGFLYAWRNTAIKLKKYKDDLYFVHKTYRQDSTARLSRNEMTDPTYADTTSTRPQPPPRNLYNGNTLPPIRTLSLTGETLLTDKLSEQTELKHDYLELI